MQIVQQVLPDSLADIAFEYGLSGTTTAARLAELQTKIDMLEKGELFTRSQRRSKRRPGSDDFSR